MGEKKIAKTSIADYLAKEMESEFRHEYRDGEIVAMSVGSINHGILGRNMIISIDKRLDQGSCQVMNNDIRVYLERYESFVYPDAYVVCGDIETAESDKNSITNPLLVIEVLSPNTEAYDRGNKFRKYRSLTSFKEYVLISQEEYLVETFFKQDEKTWIINTTMGLENSVQIRSIGATIPMAEIYRNLTNIDKDA